MLKDYAGALKDYELVQNHLPPGFPSDNCHFWKGDIFEFDLQDYRRAELEYSAVINSNAPRAQLTYCNRGDVRQKMGKYRDAIEDYTMFATYVGRRGVLDTYAMGQRAECYAAIGDKNAARADALKVIARATEELKESSCPADFFERGKMRILIGDIKGGRKDLETTLELLQALEKNSKDKSRQEFVSEVTCRLKGLSSN